MAGIIKADRAGAAWCDSKRADPFIAIVEAIIWQQLSGKAAATIYGGC